MFTAASQTTTVFDQQTYYNCRKKKKGGENLQIDTLILSTVGYEDCENQNFYLFIFSKLD